jgi:hypothetical protein
MKLSSTSTLPLLLLSSLVACSDDVALTETPATPPFMDCFYRLQGSTRVEGLYALERDESSVPIFPYSAFATSSSFACRIDRTTSELLCRAYAMPGFAFNEVMIRMALRTPIQVPTTTTIWQLGREIRAVGVRASTGAVSDGGRVFVVDPVPVNGTLVVTFFAPERTLGESLLVRVRGEVCNASFGVGANIALTFPPRPW